MSDDLTGKVALVTGASRGIGRAIALARVGADVGVNYRTHADEANQVCGEIESVGRRAVAIRADVSMTSDVSRLVETVEQELGHVAILINNAGVTPHPSRLSTDAAKDPATIKWADGLP